MNMLLGKVFVLLVLYAVWLERILYQSELFWGGVIVFLWTFWDDWRRGWFLPVYAIVARLAIPVFVSLLGLRWLATAAGGYDLATTWEWFLGSYGIATLFVFKRWVIDALVDCVSPVDPEDIWMRECGYRRWLDASIWLSINPRAQEPFFYNGKVCILEQGKPRALPKTRCCIR